jgi:hypothetical protein
MTMRRTTAAVSVVVLWLLTLAVAEASLGALLLLFAVVLKLNLAVQVAGSTVEMFVPGLNYPNVTLFNAALAGSCLFTVGCGAAAAARTYRRWRLEP